jgi:hypothetical protein
MDIVVSAVDGRHYWFDVGVTSDKPEKMHLEKVKHYSALAKEHDAEFHPLIFNNEAKPHTECRKILLKLSCDFDVPMPRLMASIVSAIINGNGLIVERALKNEDQFGA